MMIDVQLLGVSIPQAEEKMTTPSAEIFWLGQSLTYLAVEVRHERVILWVLVVSSWNIVDGFLKILPKLTDVIIIVEFILAILLYHEKG
jgi:hypothetical protein